MKTKLSSKIGYLVVGTIAGLGLLVGSVSSAAILQGFQGGTGFGPSTTAATGNVLTLSSTTPWITYKLSPVIATNTGNWAGTWQGFNASAFGVGTITTSSQPIVNYIPNWSGLATLGNSILSQLGNVLRIGGTATSSIAGDGTLSTIGGALSVIGDIGSSGLRIPNIFASNIDSTNGTIGSLSVSGMISGNLIIGGTSTSTIKSDGTLTTIGGALNASGTITQNGVAVLTNVSSTIPSLPISIANGGTATSSTPTTNSLVYFNGTSITSTSTTPYNSGSFSIDLSGPSSTFDGAFAQHTFAVPVTLSQIDCWDSVGNVSSTIFITRNTSSTPNTAGEVMLTSLACGITRGVATSSLSITTSTQNYTLSFGVTSTVGYIATSTLHIQGFYTK